MSNIFRFNHVEQEERVDIPLVAGSAKFKIIGCYSAGRDGAPLVDREGNPKLNISISVKDCMGSTGIVYQTLTVNNGFIVRNILAALGLEALYDKSGQLDADDIIGGEGSCVLKMQAGSNGYADRIVIDKYTKAAKQAVVKKDYGADLESDEIPF